MMDVSDEALKAISHELESESPEAILRWADDGGQMPELRSVDEQYDNDGS